jgi:hypothetical protein
MISLIINRKLFQKFAILFGRPANFMLFLFATSSLSLGLSIDFGSSFVKSSIVTGSDLPEIARGAQGNPSFPAFIGFRAKPKFNASTNIPLTDDETELLQTEIGAKAYTIAELRPWLATGYFTAIGALNKTARAQKCASLFVQPQAARAQFPELIGAFLKSYVNTIARDQFIEHISLILPASFTAYQRFLYQLALNATSQNISIIEDADAVAAHYLIDHSNKLTKNYRKVLFIDVGATSVKSYVVQFSTFQDTKFAKRLSYAIDTNAGGAYLSSSLVSLLKEKASATTSNDGENRRFFQAAERAKIALTAADSTVVIVDNVSEIDQSIPVSRAELEKRFLPALIESVLKVARKASDGIGFDEVELIGGSSVIPSLQKLLKTALKVSNLGTTLNPIEAAAIGGGHLLQRRLNCSFLPFVNVTHGFQLFDVDVQNGPKPVPLCRIGAPCEPRMSFMGVDAELTISFLGGPITPGLETTVDLYRVSRNTFGNITTHFSVQSPALVRVDKCNFSKPCKPGVFRHVNPPDVSREQIILLVDPDARTERLARLKTELEQFVIKVLDEVAHNATVRGFSNTSQRTEIVRCAEAEKVWIQSPEAAKVAEAKNVTAHFTAARKCIGPVYRRIQDNRTLWENAARLHTSLGTARQMIEKWKGYGSPADAKDVAVFERLMTKNSKWFNETFPATIRVPPWRPPPTKPSVFRERFVEFEAAFSKMKDKFGANGPTVMRKDGTRASKEETENMMGVDMIREIQRYQNPPETDEDEDIV